MILAENPEKAVKIIKKKIAEAKEWLAKGVEAEFLIKEIDHAMSELFDYAMNNLLLEKLFRNFINDIKSWLLTIKQSAGGYDTEKNTLRPFLFECACIGSINGGFNRFKNDMREKVESSVMEFLKNHLAVIDRNEIRYMSLGSGEMLQDFLILIQILLLLAESKRKDIKKEIKLEINLVDPLYENLTDQLTQTGNQFDYLDEFANELGILYSLEIYSSIDDYLADKPKNQDIVMATDFDTFHSSGFNSVVKAHKNLDPRGQLFLSLEKDRYIFSKTKSLLPLPAVSFLNQLPLKNKKHVKIASLIERNILTVYPMILPFIQQLKDCETVTLTLPHPQKRNEEGFWMGAKFPDLRISCADLTYIFSLFVPENMKLVVNYFTGNKNFEKLLPQISEEQDLVLCYDKKCKLLETLFKDIAVVHNTFPSADILFDMKFEKVFDCCWIYDHAANETNIIEGNELSEKILVAAYQSLVAENLKPK